MNTGNLTVGGDILTTLGAPADVRALGYQVYTYNNTAMSLTTSAQWYYSGLSFSVDSTNYGTYLIEFCAQLATTATSLSFLHMTCLSTSSTTASPSYSSGQNNSYFARQYLPSGSQQLIRSSRTFSLYTTQTIYGMVYLSFSSGTAQMNNASLNVTRIA
jgi:hypothetical protein